MAPAYPPDTLAFFVAKPISSVTLLYSVAAAMVEQLWGAWVIVLVWHDCLSGVVAAALLMCFIFSVPSLIQGVNSSRTVICHFHFPQDVLQSGGSGCSAPPTALRAGSSGTAPLPSSGHLLLCWIPVFQVPH